ncbi:hypothetical protein [Methanimicrococcus hongohii]|uniref:hypothetical protein n=1 Tax=Methanimicrococcus hongohii TaxID=3028295 RepID=UPI00292F5009|nr:hypothetical protein [Methanimicrococcus sp. Hf6]
MSAPAEPVSLQLSFNVAAAIRFALPLQSGLHCRCNQVCIAAAIRFALLLPVRFALPPVSANFIVIRSHSRTCRRYFQVCVSACNQFSVSACNQFSVSACKSGLRRSCRCRHRSSCPPPREPLRFS